MTREEREYEKSLRSYLLKCEKKFRTEYAEKIISGLSLEDYKRYADEYINGQRWESINTKRKNEVGVNKFLCFMEAEGYEVIDTISLLAYRRSLVNYASNTVAQYMKRLNASFNWMKDMRLIQENPIPKSMLIVERYEDAKAVLSPQEIILVLNAGRQSNTRKEVFVRNRAIVILLLTSGLREAEALAVTPEDLHWEEASITVKSGKGRKTRKVPFLPVAQNVVREYMQVSRPEEAGDFDPLFLTREKNGSLRPMGTTTLYEAVCNYLERATGRNDLTPHSLRHSFASVLVSDNMNVKNLQTVLGHSSLLTTQRYAQLLAPDISPIEAAKDTFDKLMPIHKAMELQRENLDQARHEREAEKRKMILKQKKRERRGRPVKARIPAYPKPAPDSMEAIEFASTQHRGQPQKNANAEVCPAQF